MAIQLDKVYDPQKVESRWYEYWLGKRYFHANNQSGKKPYVIVIPPPNVTGILTMGHVLNNTLQDILVRHARMNGYETLWLPAPTMRELPPRTLWKKSFAKTEKPALILSVMIL